MTERKKKEKKGKKSLRDKLNQGFFISKLGRDERVGSGISIKVKIRKAKKKGNYPSANSWQKSACLPDCLGQLFDQV